MTGGRQLPRSLRQLRGPVFVWANTARYLFNAVGLAG
jgi:hypothetical protein